MVKSTILINFEPSIAKTAKMENEYTHMMECRLRQSFTQTYGAYNYICNVYDELFPPPPTVLTKNIVKL